MNISNISKLLIIKLIKLGKKIDRELCFKLPGPLWIIWVRLWVRKDEFHPSLDNKVSYLRTLNEKQRADYFADQVRRRDIAHRRDLH